MIDNCSQCLFDKSHTLDFTYISDFNKTATLIYFKRVGLAKGDSLVFQDLW